MLSFNIKGCKVSFGVGFFALITLMLMTCRTGLVLSSLICSFFHEAGHIFTMLFFGERLNSITFSAIGINIEKSAVGRLNYTQEVAVSLAGIVANIILAVILFMFSKLFSCDTLSDTAAVSLAVGGFNLLPIDSLDGAAALRYFLISRYDERKAETVIFALSLISTAFLLVFAVITLFVRQANFSLIAVTVYLAFLLVRRLCLILT